MYLMRLLVAFHYDAYITVIPFSSKYILKYMIVETLNFYFYQRSLIKTIKNTCDKLYFCCHYHNLNLHIYQKYKLNF